MRGLLSFVMAGFDPATQRRARQPSSESCGIGALFRRAAARLLGGRVKPGHDE
jgi:hypothetical protein